MKVETAVFEMAIRKMELVYNKDDKLDICIKEIRLVPCCCTGESSTTFKELELRAKGNNFANNLRQARYLLSHKKIIPRQANCNLLFTGTIWQDKNKLLWIPFLRSLYFPIISKERWVLSLKCVQGELWLRHNHDHFVQIIS